MENKLDEITKAIEDLNWRMDKLSSSWNEYDDWLVTKSSNDLSWYDKAVLNLNPNLNAKREQYQSLLSQSWDLNQQLVNLQSAQDILQDSINNQRDHANRLYDLQNMAARLSAEINWWGSTAWWLWAWAGQISQARSQIDNQAYANMLANEQNRQSALASIAQQEAAIPTTLSSIWMNNANIQAALAQSNYYSQWWGSWSSSWSSSKWASSDVSKKLINDWWYWVDAQWNIVDKNWKVYIAWKYTMDNKWNIYTWDWKMIMNNNWKVDVDLIENMEDSNLSPVRILERQMHDLTKELDEKKKEEINKVAESKTNNIYWSAFWNGAMY